MTEAPGHPAAQVEPAAPAGASPLPDKIERWLLKTAYSNNFANIGVNLVAGIAMTALLARASQSAVPAILLGIALFLLSAGRFALSCGVGLGCDDILATPARRLSRLRLLYGTGLFLGALWWVGMTALAFESGDDRVRYAVLIVLSALAAGATGILAAQVQIGRFYIALMLIQGSAQLALSSDGDIVLAGLGPVFLVVMLIVHRNNHAILVQSLDLRFRNDDLLADLKTQKGALTELNTTLEGRVALRTADLKHAAEHDCLTQCLNRQGILEWVDQQTSPGRFCTTIFLDLDRFKQINDGLGHTVGDCVLTEVARRLEAAMPEGAALCRWGGDEFVAIAPSCEPEAIATGAALADRLRSAIREKISVSGCEIHVSLSAGVAVCALEAAAVSEAIRFADLAASEAKGRGRGATVVFSEDFAARQERKAILGQALKGAVGNGELSVVFQPIVDAVTQEPEAYEVLLRWTNPVLGRISAEEFIPMAEETGLIVEIGAFAIDAAFSRFSRWPQRKESCRIALNASIQQLIAPGYVETLRAAARRYGIAPKAIVIEVTESIFADAYMDLTQNVLFRLQDLGIDIHIDDFGTGFSSLSRLHEMPVQAIKIDQSFVRRMDPQAVAIIEGSVSIAEKFGIATVAEGVETQAQAAQLRAMRVTYMQGYLFGRPEIAPTLTPATETAAAPRAAPGAEGFGGEQARRSA
ncbi:putative bifunctional diguanylate cyclase/phosphodiesterase [Rhodobacter maris]|uniref:Diguanylate cyclase/phosphodiesterase n=1 Tax=Rhodobacter maris TaxID=446682 RepID=A0A285T0F5_9RHOB|nr:bifunctional diguanylate cyclase/phosphodiesterase [Rhodobacter maris]SOC12582.1 diguanylate cyclase/phosphodiesterase [Rhodobacter maris]